MTFVARFCLILLTFTATLAVPLGPNVMRRKGNPNSNLQTFRNIKRGASTLLTYRLESSPLNRQLSHGEPSIIATAFYMWSKSIPITFDRACEACSTDIVIVFGQYLPRQQTVQCTVEPSKYTSSSNTTSSAIIHLNRAIRFDNNTLFRALAHGIGHILGLGDNVKDKNSVMSSVYLKSNNRIEGNDLPVVDREAIQSRYGKRTMSGIPPYSTWSSQPERQNILSNETQPNELASYSREQKQLTGAISQYLLKSNSVVPRRSGFTKELLSATRWKVSNGIVKDAHGRWQAYHFDQSNKLYLTNYTTNRIFIYPDTTKREKPTILARDLRGPRALHVTSDGRYLYVVDDQGLHRLGLNAKWMNPKDSTLLFSLNSSWEISSIIIDEEDFHTAYLYETRNKQVLQCRVHPVQDCKRIVDLRNNAADLDHEMSMVIDDEGDLLLLNNVKNIALRYKHQHGLKH